MRFIFNNLINWINKNKFEFAIVLGIVFIGALFRLYKIDEYMTFLGDEGRDVVIVRRFLVNGDIFLIGPGTSIGNMYLGPLYYYLIAPALWVFGYSPVGPAVMIAVFGIFTIALVWHVAREWFSSKAGLIAAFLYAIAPTVIVYSRSSWNPNIMPFFSILCVYSIWRVYAKSEFKWLLVIGFSYAFVLQSHYLGLLLAPTLAVFWILALFKNLKMKIKNFLFCSFLGLVIFIGLMSPLVIFDSRHGWRNFEAIKTFFVERQSTVSAKPWNALPNFWPLLQKTTSTLLAGKNEILGSWVAAFLISGLAIVIKDINRLDRKKTIPFAIITVWMGFALLGLGLYKQEIYDHYYGFFFATPFVLFAGISSVLISKAKIRGWWIIGTVLVFLTYFNIINNPLNYPPNRQLQKTEEVARKIKDEARGEKFNLAVLAERNYEDAYQYFLEKWGTGVIDIDPLRADETIANQLFVVCEIAEEKCDPTHNPKTEIANFGWSRISEKWYISGIVLYRLVHVDI